MKKIICFFKGHKMGITYRNNEIAINMDKKTIMIWAECRRCLKTLAYLEFPNTGGHVSQVWENNL